MKLRKCLLAILSTFLISTTSCARDSSSGIWSKADVIDYSLPDEDGEPLGEADFELIDLPDADLGALGIRPDSSADNPDVGDDSARTEDKLRKGINEGDIMIKKDKFSSVKDFAEASGSLSKNAIANKWRQWPRGEIPYVMSSRYSSYARRTIASAIKEYHDHTCIRFIARDPAKHRDYIFIHPDDGCYSLVGRTGGRQSLSLDSGCVQKGTIIHELMHTVGFFHEQSRTDRDDYIRIVWDNVMGDARDQFEKYSLRTITSLGEDYDYGSIMHYGPRAFSRNGRATIVPIARDGSRLSVSMGQRRAFSATDLRKINKLYRCEDEEEATRRPSASGEEDESCTDTANAQRCHVWNQLGYCDRYDTVAKNCQQSCGFCGSGRHTTAKPTTTTEETVEEDSEDSSESGSSGSLTDFNSNCRKWAFERKLCQKAAYKSLMGNLCPRSCARAARRKEKKPVDEACQDENPGRCELISAMSRCPEHRVVSGQKCLTKNGWSNELAKLYFQSCRRSCNLCDVKICKIVVNRSRRSRK